LKSSRGFFDERRRPTRIGCFHQIYHSWGSLLRINRKGTGIKFPKQAGLLRNRICLDPVLLNPALSASRRGLEGRLRQFGQSVFGGCRGVECHERLRIGAAVLCARALRGDLRASACKPLSSILDRSWRSMSIIVRRFPLAQATVRQHKAGCSSMREKYTRLRVGL
jgi:hypothetical protein